MVRWRLLIKLYTVKKMAFFKREQSFMGSVLKAMNGFEDALGTHDDMIVTKGAWRKIIGTINNLDEFGTINREANKKKLGDVLLTRFWKDT